MLRFSAILAVLILFVSSSYAGRKKEKAGDFEGAVYVDNAFNFSFTLHDNWRAKVGAEKNAFRVILSQKNPAIPTHYQETPDYTQVPRLVVFADTTKLSASVFVDSLLSQTYKTKQKSEILKEFTIFEEGELVPKGKRPISVGGINGTRWDAQSKYIKNVYTSASGAGGKRVESYYAGTIITVKNGNTLFAFHLICEGPYHESIVTEVMTMIGSVQFAGAKQTSAVGAK